MLTATLVGAGVEVVGDGGRVVVTGCGRVDGDDEGGEGAGPSLVVVDADGGGGPPAEAGGVDAEAPPAVAGAAVVPGVAPAPARADDGVAAEPADWPLLVLVVWVALGALAFRVLAVERLVVGVPGRTPLGVDVPDTDTDVLDADGPETAVCDR